MVNVGETSTQDVSMEDAGRTAQPVKIRHEIPPKYASWQQSDLRFTVQADGENQFEIELKD